MRTSINPYSRRYLALYSYNGSQYHGMLNPVEPNVNKKGILNVIEDSLQRFNKKQYNIATKIRGASRTDVGVHALCNAFTFDASDDHENRKLFQTEDLRRGMNAHFSMNQEKIQINQLHLLKDPWFDCRGAPLERTYIYKIILTNDGPMGYSCPHTMFLKDFAWNINSSEINLDKFMEGAKLFEGTHSFKHFVKIKLDEVSLASLSKL
eukprot:403373855